MRIAIVGGIGSGKSTVLEIIAKKGYVVRSADEINKNLLADEKYIRLLEAAFPDVVENGKVDKDSLRKQIFTDKAKRVMLNNIAHPMIRNSIAKIDADPLFVEVPLIVESGMHEDFDKIILVTAKSRTKTKRVKNRNNVSKFFVSKVMRAQMGDKALKPYADIIIKNDGSVEELQSKVEKVLKDLI